mgnify:CR=1 FL=1
MTLTVNVYLDTGLFVSVKMTGDEYEEASEYMGHPNRSIVGGGYTFDCEHIIGLKVLEYVRGREHGC